MSTRVILVLVAVACIFAHVYAADWGLNGTLSIKKAEAFTSTPGEQATHVVASKPQLDLNAWTVSYRSPVSVGGKNDRLVYWQIAMGDKPTISINPFNGAIATIPPATGCMAALGYTAPDSAGVVYANVILAGGISPNGVRSAAATGTVLRREPENRLGAGLDDVGFPDIPLGRSNGIVEADTTAALNVDSGGFANASVYIYGGEYDSGVTGTMLKMRTLPGMAIPNGWDEITFLGPNEPEPRSHHAGVAVGNQWYIFGGWNTTHVFGDMWVFNFANYNWTLLHDFGTVPVSQAGESWATELNQTLPWIPQARFGHTMTLMVGSNTFGNSNPLIILAAGTNNVTYFNDIWAFDPLFKAWEIIKLPGPSYAPRAFSALMASNNESYVWLYGGEDSSNIYGDVWLFDFTPIPPKGPSFKSLPNNIIAGVAGGILLVLIITVVVLKVTDRNSS